MDFFDEDDDEPGRTQRRSGPSRRPPGGDESGTAGGVPPSPQQVRARRAGLLIGAVVLLILIVIAFRGCLDARAERGFQNYVSDLSAITAESDQLSSGFFDRLENRDGGELNEVGLTTEVDGDRGTAGVLLDRAANLDSPDEVDAAQQQIVLAFELRNDAIEGIALALDRALGNAGANKAIASIYTQMKVLSASDILFARARSQIEQALVDQDVVVDEGVPRSQFLPEDPDYLDRGAVEAAIAGLGGSVSGGGGGGGDCDDDLVHGLGLGAVTLLPSGTALTEGAAITAGSGDDEVSVEVQNQGEADESEIQVGLGDDVSGNETIASIAAGTTETATIAMRPPPGSGETIEFTVDVALVPCEQEETNNTATYSVSFP